MTQSLYLLLLLGVALLRLAEIRISRRNQRLLATKGVVKVREPHFRWMVLFHVAILVSAGVEVVLFRRPFIPILALAAGGVFVLAIALRWWAICVMSEHWNIQVMASVELGVVVAGPYRWVRHPNYVAVFVELIALPLIHTAWLTALIGTVFHYWVLRERIRIEEATLLANPMYVTAMGSKPRFFPRLFRSDSKSVARG